MNPRIHPATLAAAVPAPAMPEYGDPAALRRADQAKSAAPDNAGASDPRLLTLAKSASRAGLLCRVVDGAGRGVIVLQKQQHNNRCDAISATKCQPNGEVNMAGWTIKITDEAERELRHYFKKYPRETKSVLANTESILALLNSGKRIGGFQVGYFRSEGDGLYRVGQTGVKAAKETRLYVFPDERAEIIHVIGIGDKDTQPRDIRCAKKTIDTMRDKK